MTHVQIALVDASFGWGDAPPTATGVNLKLEKVNRQQNSTTVVRGSLVFAVGKCSAFLLVSHTRRLALLMMRLLWSSSDSQGTRRVRKLLELQKG